MERDRIKTLLEKYMKAETSIKEEQELREYFTKGDVAPQFKEHIPLFGYFQKEKEIEFKKEIKLTSSRKRKWYSWFAVAASIAIIGGIFLFSNRESTVQEDLGTYQDPELALQKTKDVLNMVSSIMNNGQEPLVYLNQFEKTTNKIIKTP